MSVFAPIRQFAKQVRRKVNPRRGKLAIGTVAEIGAVYDDVFEHDEHFDTLDESNAPKLRYVLDYVRPIKGQILDAGCGRGSVLRFMLENEVDAFGVELSTAACKMYLSGLPHANADIAAWAAKGHRYAGLVCLDVLEHIPMDQIDGVLEALSKLAPTGFLGIANHSSIHNGHELHVIREGRKWWQARLERFFTTVAVHPPKAEDKVLADNFRAERFFFFDVAA